jgi:hypothetical protein
VLKGRLSVLIVLTLVVVSTQCAALCAIEPCYGTETAPTSSPAENPPCHHHEAPGQAPTPCSHHQIVVQADVAQPVVTAVLAASVLTMDVPSALIRAGLSLTGVDMLAEHAPTPPDIAAPSSAVLRI